MIMPTKETAVDRGVLIREWNKEYGDLLAAGKDVPEASAEATNKIARKYKMAYYEGENGVLRRVSC